MSDLRVQLLGRFHLTYGGTTVLSLNQPRAQSLLAYLLLHRNTPQSRQQIAFTFWPDATEAQARNNLRQALFQIRRVLPDAQHWLHSDASAVWWQRDSSIQLDVETFEQALDQVEAVLHDSNQRTERSRLEYALSHYGGDLLPGCYDNWIVPARDRLCQLYRHALGQLIAVLEAAREYAAALHYAQQLVQSDPLHEEAYVTLMRLHALNQDRTGALRVYQQCAVLLQQELGVQPSVHVQAMYHQLLQQNPHVMHADHQSTGAMSATPLVGRNPEWKRLLTTWHQGIGGKPHMVLICGEAGMGKTRLADELRTWANYQGVATAMTRAYAADGQLAYAPIAEWLRSSALAAALTHLDSIWLTEITRLLPELLIAHSSLTPPGSLTEEWYWRADFVNELSETAINLHVKYGSQLPSMHSTMHLYPIDGAAHRVGKNDTAFSYRDARWGAVIVGVDPNPANTEAITNWCKDYWLALHPYSAGGAYVNMMMDEGQERVQASYRDNYARLAQIKATYDPHNLFRVNQNIKPTQAKGG